MPHKMVTPIKPNPYQDWPRWRFINGWEKLGGTRSFVLFSLWYGDVFMGISFLNFGVEYCSQSGDQHL
jgi:hypothetical protein